MPVVGFLALFMYTYLNILPWQFKLSILTLIVLGTILLPRWTIRFWRKSRGWELHLLRLRENRQRPRNVSVEDLHAVVVRNVRAGVEAVGGVERAVEAIEVRAENAVRKATQKVTKAYCLKF